MQSVILSILVQVLNEKQREASSRNEYNFDHPDAFDFDLLKKTLKRLKEGKKVEVPIYNFVTHSRETRTVSASKAFHNFHPSINQLSFYHRK